MELHNCEHCKLGTYYAWCLNGPQFMEGLFGCFWVYCPYNNIRIIPLQEIVTCRFPNPPGSNRCWMNATLQMLLGMEPFMEELECFCLRRDQNNRCEVLQSFFEVMKYRRWRRRFSLRSALRWVLSQSLGTNIGSSICTGDTCTSNLTGFCMTVKEWAIIWVCTMHKGSVMNWSFVLGYSLHVIKIQITKINEKKLKHIYIKHLYLDKDILPHLIVEN